MHRTYCICCVFIFNASIHCWRNKYRTQHLELFFFSKLQCLYLTLSFEFSIHQAVSTKILSRNCPFQSETAVSGRDPFRKLSVPVGNCCFPLGFFRETTVSGRELLLLTGFFQETAISGRKLLFPCSQDAFRKLLNNLHQGYTSLIEQRRDLVYVIDIYADSLKFTIIRYI